MTRNHQCKQHNAPPGKCSIRPSEPGARASGAVNEAIMQQRVPPWLGATLQAVVVSDQFGWPECGSSVTGGVNRGAGGSDVQHSCVGAAYLYPGGVERSHSRRQPSPNCLGVARPMPDARRCSVEFASFFLSKCALYGGDNWHYRGDSWSQIVCGRACTSSVTLEDFEANGQPCSDVLTRSAVKAALFACP